MLPKQLSSSYINLIVYYYFKIIKPNFIFDELSLNLQSEQMPSYASKVFLSNNLDKYKQNKLIIDWKLNKTDFETTNFFQKLITEKFENSLFFV